MGIWGVCLYLVIGTQRDSRESSYIRYTGNSGSSQFFRTQRIRLVPCFKVHNSVAFSTRTASYDHHLCLVLEHFHHRKRNLRAR